jgi:hypothetical protein
MSATKVLVDALYREEIARARAMTPAEKLLEGPRLFERARRVMIDGIRHQHPHLDDAGVLALLAERLYRLQALDRL